MTRKTAALLVVLLAATAARPIACAWWCAPGEALHTSCHDQSSSDGAQLSTGSSCDVDVVDAVATLTKAASLERVAFVVLPSRDQRHDLSGHATLLPSSSPPGPFLQSRAQHLTVLRI